MPREKIYKCCICHEIQEEKPIRLTKQLYRTKGYGQYYPIEHYDFCRKCYRKFNAWLKKHEEE